MNLKAFICTIYCLIVISSPVFAQHIRLDDLSKIELFSDGPWWSEPGMKWVEILPEGNVWNCYHLRSQQRPKLVRDSTRRLIKAIPAKDLKQLLGYINNPDTILKFEPSSISASMLKQYIDTIQKARKELDRHERQDSLLIYLTPAQKAYFFKIIESKQAVKDAGLKALHPFDDDDRSYYGMVFTHKDKRTDTVYSSVNSFRLYHLPWQIKNKQSYNPHLAELFESMLDNEGYDKIEKGRLAYQVDYELFTRWVLTKISWDDYKANHSANYKQLSKTLTPVSNLIYYKSARLPFNIQLRFKYTGNDTLNTSEYNSREQEVISWYKKGGFFFDYMKAHPTTIAFVVDVRPQNIEQVKTIYPDILKFDEREIKFVYTSANFYQGMDLKRGSGWLLLPDGKMILIHCGDQLIKDGDRIFADFPLISDKSEGYFCIVYDREGHKIASGKSQLSSKSK